MEPTRRLAIKALCEQEHLFFTSYFFLHREGFKFRLNWHHHLIADVIEDVIQGRRKNVVINVPPGSSKTELVAINLIARGLAINPRCRFLYLSYSDTLVSEYSAASKAIVNSEPFQELWPIRIATDSSAKHLWHVVDEKSTKVGGVYAVATGGQVTGFRAGRMAPGFYGAILIDDPLKPEDAYSDAKTKAANRKLLTTVKSRKANPDTPIIVIMQRIGEKDPTAFIQDGNVPGDWDSVVIPALITDEYVNKLPAKYKAMQGTPLMDDSIRDPDGRWSYWPYKEPLVELLALEKGGGTDKDGNMVSRHVFWAQYMQQPKPIGGGIFKGSCFGRYKVLPAIKWRRVYGDTAQKTAERNDYSVFQCWGMGEDGRIYLLDQIRGKWEAHELKKRAVDFWNKHLPTETFRMGPIRQMAIEDKASGTGLIQDIRKEGKIPIKAIERNKDKLTRAMDAQPYIESGLVFIPEQSSWVSDYVSEFEAFTADDTHAHDDQIDPTLDAINDMLGKAKSIYDNL